MSEYGISPTLYEVAIGCYARAWLMLWYRMLDLARLIWLTYWRWIK